MDCGGYRTEVEGLTFISSTRIVRFEWEFEGVLDDIDGSISGTIGAKILPTTGTLPSTCVSVTAGYSTGIATSLCPSDMRFIRFAFNSIVPSSLNAKNAIFKNSNGQTIAPWHDKRLTHKKGWMTMLISEMEYELSFENGGQITNLTYNGLFSALSVSITENTAYKIYCMCGLKDLVSKKVQVNYIVISRSWRSGVKCFFNLNI